MPDEEDLRIALTRGGEPRQGPICKALRITLSLLGKLDQLGGYDCLTWLVPFFDLDAGARNLKCNAEKPNSLGVERVSI